MKEYRKFITFLCSYPGITDKGLKMFEEQIREDRNRLQYVSLVLFSCPGVTAQAQQDLKEKLKFVKNVFISGVTW